MRKTIMLSVFLISAVGLSVSCVTTSYALLGPDLLFAPVPWEQVEIYLSEDDVEEDFVKMAILSAEGKEGFTDEQDMYNSFCKKAGQLGADAIIIQGVKDPSDVERMADAVRGGFGFGTRQGRAIAIKYKKNIK